MFDAPYRIEGVEEIASPALVVFRELVERNLERMIAIAGGAGRLRPHAKTHKMAAVAHLELARGIVRHKCATLAEARMLAEAGAPDVLLAYALVGPNIPRALELAEQYPELRLSVLGDHPRPLGQLSEAAAAAGRTIGVLLDVDAGQHRTGVLPGADAVRLYADLCRLPGLRPEGLHLYDGHNQQPDVVERTRAVLAGWEATVRLRDELERARLPVPRVVAGGTGSFPIFARIEDESLELSPGTCVFHDAGYRRRFADLDFTPAALLVTRVVSRPTAERVTLDLGYKACASDPPAGERLEFPELPDAREVLHNEEHLVLETSRAAEFAPGDALLAIPRHICPTTALHAFAWVVAAGGRLVDRWPVTARDR